MKKSTYIVNLNWRFLKSSLGPAPGGDLLLGIFGRGVPPGSQNPDPISDQNIPFSTPVFRPGLENTYSCSDLCCIVIKLRINNELKN